MSKRFKKGDTVRLKVAGEIPITTTHYMNNHNMLEIISSTNKFLVNSDCNGGYLTIAGNFHMWHPDDFILVPKKNIVGGELL